MKTPVVLSMEQALTMTYATLRCVHLGWRVIRLEPTPVPGRKTPGDPNRYIGKPIAGDDRHSYFVAPNLGKEAMALNLKDPKGQELLRKLIKDLDVDVFCTNTIPKRHEQLGLDYETLKREREDLIWCSISAMGSKYPNVPGYDPVLQAMCGYNDLTGHADGPPLQVGVPIVDLKAGDEAFTQIVIAMMERNQTGKGKAIDISMAQVAVSWLQTFTPMLDMGSPPSELKRSGNEHRQFVPVNAYQTADGFIYMALGSDAQWARFVKEPAFISLDDERFATNSGRRDNRVELHGRIGAITKAHPSSEMTEAFNKAGVPNSPITRIEDLPDMPFVSEAALTTTTTDGDTVRLPPPAVSTEHLEKMNNSLPFAPAYGEHTDALLEEVGLGATDIASLREKGVVA
ncbi:MAG: CoA transferase [Deltaproteobacteria bacterium]|nr:CoA transferase [Deltaproteobacteria bacterium]